MRISEIPEGHPRIYLRPADLAAVREKTEMAEFQPAWDRVRQSKRAVCKAFVYLMLGDMAAGREAVAQGLEDLRSGSDGRLFYNFMHRGACVYDWCYDLLSDADKQDYIEAFKQFAALDHDRGYPPDENRMNSTTGHDCEGFIMTNALPAGVAVYDEWTGMYELAARIFFERFVESCNFYYTAHLHHQGTHYNGERFVHDQATAWLFRRFGAGDVFSGEQQFVLYQLLYTLRPDGKFLKAGDDNDGLGESSHKCLPARLASSYYGDPFLLSFSECKTFSPGHADFYAIFDLLFLEPDAARAPFQDLPLTRYFGSPMGTMIARTGWDLDVESRNAVVHMHIGEYHFGNHHHRDFGTFQIYYRGPLAIDTGVYQAGDDSMYGTDHWRHYYRHTVAHNGLMILDPATMDEDYGGQSPADPELPRSLAAIEAGICRLAEVTGRAFGPDPAALDYSYLAGNITGAYADSKARKVERSMVTINTRNQTHPLVFVVFDRVVSTHPEFKKAWYLHSIQEPQVEGRSTTIVRDGLSDHEGEYGGQLVVETLLPSVTHIEKVGGDGRECWNEATQTNYVVDMTDRRAAGDELGAWRIEVIPAEPSEEDLFLNVLTAMDVGTVAPEVVLVEADGLVGARTVGQTVLFSRAEEPLREASFELEGDGEQRALICGVEPGEWEIGGPRGMGETYRVTDEGKCLYIQGEAGEYRVRTI